MTYALVFLNSFHICFPFSILSAPSASDGDTNPFDLLLAFLGVHEMNFLDWVMTYSGIVGCPTQPENKPRPDCSNAQ